MTTFTYPSFVSKQGLLVDNGGVWTCQGFDATSCTQILENNAYGPIKSSAAPGINNNGYQRADMYLRTTISLVDDQFKGAASMTFTFSFNVQATAQGGSPDPITLQSNVGGILYTFPQSVPYNSTSPISATQSSSFGAPTKMTLLLQPFTSNLNGATVTLEISNLSFVIHDIAHGASSMAGSLPPSASLAPSPSSEPSLGPSSASSTNHTTSLPHSTPFTTTISGHATIIQTLPLPSAPSSESQPYLPSPSNSPSNSSMTVSELAGVIAGSLIGVGVVLIAIALWYKWWRRRSINNSGKTSYGDGQSETYADSSTANQEDWVPRPYHKRPCSSTTEDAMALSVEDERMGPIELGEQDGHLNSSSRGENHRFNPPPPAYSQITPRPALRSSIAIENA